MRRMRIGLISLSVATLLLLCSGATVVMLTDPRNYPWHLQKVITNPNPSTASVPLGELKWSPALVPNRFTLEFAANRVHGRGICNYFSGAYQMDTGAGVLSVSGVHNTNMRCGSNAEYDIDREFLDLLSMANRYEARWRELRIYIDARQTVLVFEQPGPSFSLGKLIRQFRAWIQ